MNTPQTDFAEQTKQNSGLTCDFGRYASQHLGNQQTWNTGIRLQPSLVDVGPQQQNFRPQKSSSSIMSRFESPASAFYATERFLGFPQSDYHVSGPVYSSQHSKSYDSQISSHQFSGENYSIDSAEQADPNLELRNTLQSIVKSHFSGYNCDKSSESCKGQFSTFSGNKIHPTERNKVLRNDAMSIGNHFPTPFQGNRDYRVSYDPHNTPLAQLCFSTQQDQKQSPRFGSGGVSTGAALANKTRIRWTQDLHEKFVECVNRLGGAEKATPKAILKLMDTDGLTIFHVKSHLQKYRIAKYMPDSSEGKSQKKSCFNDVSQLDAKTGFQIRETLHLQLDVQKRLHEQLEIQRNLQLRIEEQGEQLKMMFDQQRKTTNVLFRNHNMDIKSPDHASMFCVEDVGISTAEVSSTTSFPSKIS